MHSVYTRKRLRSAMASAIAIVRDATIGKIEDLEIAEAASA